MTSHAIHTTQFLATCLQGSLGNKFARLHETFLHGAWPRFTRARLHGACIVRFKLNYKQRQKVTFKLANTNNVF